MTCWHELSIQLILNSSWLGKKVVTITVSGSNILKDFRTFGPEFESEQDDVEFIEIRDVLKETQVEEDEDAVQN